MRIVNWDINTGTLKITFYLSCQNLIVFCFVSKGAFYYLKQSLFVTILASLHNILLIWVCVYEFKSKQFTLINCYYLPIGLLLQHKICSQDRIRTCDVATIKDVITSFTLRNTWLFNTLFYPTTSVMAVPMRARWALLG